MATDLFKAFDAKKPSFRTNMLEDAQDPNFNFNIENTELFKGAANTAQKQMAGDVPQFDTYANETREAQKTQQANAANAQREALFSSGLANTGRRLQFEMATPNQQARERTELERGLTADRSSLAMQQQQQGVQNATALAGMQQQGQQFNRSDATQRYGIDVNAQMQREQQQWQSGESALDRALTKEVEQGRITVEEKKIVEQARQFDNEIDFKRWATQAGLDDAAAERIWQSAENTKQIEAQRYGVDVGRENVLSEIESREKLGFAQIKSTERMANADRALQERIQDDEVYLRQQGINLQSASIYGYTDANGQRVPGQMELAFMDFGLNARTIDNAEKELFGYTDPTTGQYVPGKMYLMNEQDQRDAAALFGYQDPTTGEYVPGSLRINARLADIQGISVALEGKRVQQTADALYGYTDPTTGERVKGSAEISQEVLGLENLRYDDQRKELYGYTDPVTGKVIKGKYEMLNDSQKMAADELYGYEVKDANGKPVIDKNTGLPLRVSGTLELQQQSVAIQQQGMTIEEAKVKGYQHPETGEWVSGMAEIAMQQVGIDTERLRDEKKALYGYTKADGTYVPGTMANNATALGLQAKTVDMQEKELWGYTDPKTGERVKGKYDFLSEEQKMQADRLYGYVKKDADGNPVLEDGKPVWVPGEYEAQKMIMTLQQEFAMKGVNIGATLDYLRTADPDAAAEIIGNMAVDAGMTYRDDDPSSPTYGQDVPGMKPVGDEKVRQATYQGIMDNYTVNNKKMSVQDADKLSKAIAAGDKDLPMPIASSDVNGTPITKIKMMYPDDSGKGYDRWKLTDEARTWAEQNRGRLWRDPDTGRVYEVVSPSAGGERYNTPGIALIDVTTGQQIIWSNTSGVKKLNGKSAKSRPLSGHYYQGFELSVNVERGSTTSTPTIGPKSQNGSGPVTLTGDAVK